MTRASGAKTSVKFAQEVEWKHEFDPEVYPLGNVYGLNIRSCSLGGSKNQFQSETINDKRAVVGLGEGNKAVEGDIVTDFLQKDRKSSSDIFSVKTLMVAIEYLLMMQMTKIMANGV